MEFQELMHDRFVAVIEDATGRPVIGFMSGNQQDLHMMCEVFILEPTDPVEPGRHRRLTLVVRSLLSAECRRKFGSPRGLGVKSSVRKRDLC